MRTTTRREFLGSSLAGGVAAALGRASAFDGQKSASPESTPGFMLGLASYTFREFDLDTTVAAALRLGLRPIALKDVHLPLDSPEDVLRTTAEKIKAAGLDLYGCGVVYMTNEAEVDRAFAYAKTGGMRVIIGVPEHGLLGRAEARVRETGIRLAIHNHGPGDLRYPTPGSILDLIGKLDGRIGVCLDVGHCRRSGLDPADEAVRCGPRLLDVHMKDVTAPSKDGLAVEVGRGIIDVPRFLRALGAMGYQGTAAFEYEKDGRDPLPGLAESVGYVRGVLAGLGGRRDRPANEDGGSA